MKAGWIIGLVMLYIVLTPIFGMIEQNFLPAGQPTVLGTLLTPSLESYVTPTNVLTGGISIAITWLQALWKVLTFGYACFSGTWIILRFLLCAISIGIIGQIVLSLIGSRSS
jgi:hypothetical protein